MPLDLNELSTRLGSPPVTRFAPSPTGFLHLGHVVNAIYVWGIARALGGRVLLRIEDHDRIRSRSEYERALLDDLEWLGFDPDEGIDPVRRQMDEPDVYDQALSTLRAGNRVYACDCSRKDIGSERYDGRCRMRQLEERPGHGTRVEISESREYFEDALLGPFVQMPSQQCGDLLLRDRDGHWTYQFAVTVDDCRQGITLVIRGEDLLSSTGRQIALARMLGRANPPVFLHHPLLRDTTGEKLSKSTGDTGLKQMRASGASAPEIIGRAAFLVGLLSSFRKVPAASVPALFGP